MTEKVKPYTELNVWKKSRELTNFIYTLTKSFPAQELYGLTSQIRRCSVSVPSNIAEGSGRNHAKDSIQFFHIARGSLYELETQAYLAFDQKYINNKDLDSALQMITECKKLINGYIRYFRTLT
ncbi:four helix bundle protein [candidate division TA06 bacterium]|uniref:Four helix bundle protein n=1 Tax=candidate division TA06 bacterium TaxID=2250710 RepID=A0A933ML72_UNCT6|nr:four helix bundle protein [candidate division TA06 bacterium]